jgi:hypothetical protein
VSILSLEIVLSAADELLSAHEPQTPRFSKIKP